MTRHPECGEPVVVVAGGVLDPDGEQHLCRDYLAWHLPADRRHPDDLPWPAEAGSVEAVSAGGLSAAA